MAFVYFHGSPSISGEQTIVRCPFCGHLRPPTETRCTSVGIALRPRCACQGSACGWCAWVSPLSREGTPWVPLHPAKLVSPQFSPRANLVLPTLWAPQSLSQGPSPLAFTAFSRYSDAQLSAPVCVLKNGTHHITDVFRHACNVSLRAPC